MSGMSQKRIRWERLIWVIDIATYALLGAAGTFALWLNPPNVTTAVQVSWIVVMWGMLLLVGGMVAAIGRALRVWAVEYVANVFAAWGAFLFAIILIPAAVDSQGWAGVLAFVCIAWLSTMRRYSELRIFANDLRGDSLRVRLEVALRRRTQNVVARQHY